jgi:two-component system, LytTR family, sensor kinase
MTQRRLYWLLHGGGWTVAVLVFFGIRLLTLSGQPVSALEVFNWLLYWTLAVFLTHRFRLRIRSGWLDLPWYRTFHLHAAWILGIGLCLGLQVVLVGGAWRGLPRGRFPWEYFFSIWFNAVFVTCLWLGCYISIVMVRRYSEARNRALALELAAKEARLRNLQAQVNPHFLFNSLNSVRALILEDAPRAVEAVTWLSTLLRYSLRSDRDTRVPLAEELEMVGQYLALEKLRFEDRLQVSIAIPASLHSALIPPLLLQTLVENAIKHGIAHLPNGGRVELAANPANQGIQLEIRNTGRLQAPSSQGIGLSNARERLHLLYGPNASVELSESNGEVVARVHLPKITTEAAA